VLIVAVGLGLMATFVFARSYSQVALQKEPFDRTAYVPSFDPVEDVTLGLSPNSGDAAATTPDPTIRAVSVYPTQTLLLSGGRAVRVIEAPAPTDLHALVALVNDPGWLSESGQTVTVKAAVLVQAGQALSVAAPLTTEVIMTVRPGVFLAAVKATLTLSGVYVHASDRRVPNTFADPAVVLGRPFILAMASKLTISNSTFRYLGRDWNSSYGVSWSKGSTGSVTGSLFDHNFIGVYSNAATDLSVLHNRFYNNTLYGVDPHSGTTRLDVEYNTANFNGRHGIIFSDHVTAGVVRHNVTRGNGLNGIMMDEESTGNTIDHNTVEGNTSDGIVLANSGGNTVLANTVRGNRVGISVRGKSDGVSIARNTVSGNQLAVQGTRTAGNHVSNNGGEWIPARIVWIWAGALVLLLALCAITWVGGRRPRRGRAGPHHAVGGIA
jgi:poly(beta-D-mannuronate) C5 epimerase